MKLVAAVAAERFEQVAGEAGRMQPHERGGDFRRIAQHKHERLLRFVLDAIGDDRAGAVFRGQLGLGFAVHEFFADAAISDELLDRDDRQIETSARSCNCSRLARSPDSVENFAEHAGGQQAGHAGQIDRGLGVAGAAEHAAFFGHQRKQMPRPNEVVRLARRVADRLDRARPFRRP